MKGRLSTDAFTASLIIEASGPGGRSRVKLLVHALSAAQERAREQHALERVRREASERAALEARERERTERELREHREREERERKSMAETIKIAGDVAVVALVEKLAAAYRGAGHSVGIAVTSLPNGTDPAAVGEGRYEIGLSARNPSPGVDPSGLLFRKIALEAICVVTNGGNPISNLSGSALAGIFTGGLRNWNEVPGSAIPGPIDLFDFEATAIRQEAFQRIFLGEESELAGFAKPESSDELERAAVASDAQAIGFVSLRTTAGVNAVGYDGVPCTYEKAHDGQYGGERNFWMVTKGPPTGQAASFINWVTESVEARNVVESNWIAP